MGQVTCQECSRSLSASEAYELNGKVYCGACVQAAAQSAKEAGQPVKVMRYVDKSICARCNTYIGEGGGVEVGTVRLCLSLPLCAVLVVLNYGRVIWADLGYGIAVGVLGPIAIFRAFARF